MRILLLHHAPLAQSHAGRQTALWLAALAAAGHETRLLTVDTRLPDQQQPTIDHIVCREGDPKADLPFALPYLEAEVAGTSEARFVDLTDEQLHAYRDRLRRRLDAQVDQFDPHVLHVQHAWVWGQLAVETGVPYAVSVWGPELADIQTDPRYRPLADQAAANAGRLLAPDAETLARLNAAFEFDAERALVAPAALGMAEGEAPLDAPAQSADAAAALVELYRALLDERFGSVA